MRGDLDQRDDGPSLHTLRERLLGNPDLARWTAERERRAATLAKEQTLARPDVTLLMHADDASARGLEDGDLVRVFNDLGEVQCTLNVSLGIRPGTVSLPKGLWRRSTRNGFTGTALVPDTLTDLGGGACFNDARVQVASVASQ